MKYFVATDVSEEVKDQISEIEKQLPKETGNFSTVSHNHPHITLKFLGTLSNKELEKVKENLEKVKYMCFLVRTSKLGFFPDEKFIKVFWLGLEESKELNGLARAVRDQLPKYRGGYPFSPHITIARVRKLYNKKKFLEFTKKVKVKKIQFGIDSFKLMRSVPTDKGHIHEVVQKYKCG